MNATRMLVLICVIILDAYTSGKLFNQLLRSTTENSTVSQEENRLSSEDSKGDSNEENSEESMKRECDCQDTRCRDFCCKDNEMDGSLTWQKGIVPYSIDEESYDQIIVSRIREAMHTIESASCVLFLNISDAPPEVNFDVWLHIHNPGDERDCVHTTTNNTDGAVILVLGFDCMQKKDIIHALLHALGFEDEVTHPQRDTYIRVLWDNIQPKYRSLFAIKNKSLQSFAEYDTMSIMHFHDRAFSINGGPTIVPVISGLQIKPSDGLSQLDTMKLRLAFGSECSGRKFDNLVESCKHSLMGYNNYYPYNSYSYRTYNNGGCDSCNCYKCDCQKIDSNSS